MSTTVRVLNAGGKPRLRLETVWLRVCEGAQRDARIKLAGLPVRIGRDPDNELVIEDESISRHHALVEELDEGIRLRDLGSTNGIWMLGSRIQEAYLTPGTPFRLGSVGCELFVEEISSSEPWPDPTFHGMLGRSLPMRHLFSFLDMVAKTDLSLLLLGETGTGKEEAARAAHASSARAGGPFLVFDGAATDPGLMGASLFGQREGAFTGASRSRAGSFQAANGGSLFIDEVAEIPLDLQTKLLRVIERREVTPIGADTPVRVDVRILSATHRDLEKMVREGTFREDLFHRLAGVILVIPPLRDRREDIPLLIQRFLEGAGHSKKMERRALESLMHGEWGGNVRELRNTILRAASLCKEDTIELKHLFTRPIRFSPRGPVLEEAPEPRADPVLPGRPRKLKDWERLAILEALGSTDWKVGAAADLLGITRQTLRLKMLEYGIERPPA